MSKCEPVKNVHKKRSKAKFYSSLPIPLESESGSQEINIWTTFKGYFCYGAIIIEDGKYAQLLWQKGYFGDGSLSSSGFKLKATVGEGDSFEASEKSMEVIVPNESTVMSEVLHLCPEEALFLSYALGALVLTNQERKDMNIDDMWTAFSLLNPRFPLQYAIYHHFRCKGWIVKPGLKFGADWMLYPVGPPLYHCQYLVWAQCLWEDTLEEDATLSGRRADITSISALERLSGHVGKTVLLCQVLRPRVLTDTELKNISCLSNFIISEVTIQRWAHGEVLSTLSSSSHSVAQKFSTKGLKRMANT